MKNILNLGLLALLSGSAQAQEIQNNSLDTLENVRLLTCDRWTYFYETRSWSCTTTPREVLVASAARTEALKKELETLNARILQLEKNLNQSK